MLNLARKFPKFAPFLPKSVIWPATDEKLIFLNFFFLFIYIKSHQKNRGHLFLKKKCSTARPYLETIFHPNKPSLVSNYLFEKHYCYFIICSNFLLSGLTIKVIFNTMAIPIKDKMTCLGIGLPCP